MSVPVEFIRGTGAGSFNDISNGSLMCTLEVLL